ncbi:MAG: metallophosphoesterase, partial [Clostridia bacterium]|nr:metallophosphoesterase [Clostridia bacterium]
MKNIIVISDTHGRLPDNEFLWEAFDNADFIFHLGDGAKEIEKLKSAYPGKVHFVYGNWDGITNQSEEIVEIEGVKFFLTHGHNYKVKSSDLNLQMRGLELGADCCLYGHVHRPQITEYGNLKLINPGSLTYAKTYCYMSVVGDKVLAKIVELR